MFQSLQDGLLSAFKSLQGKGKLTEANMRDGIAMVERSLVEADVNIDVVRKFVADVSEAAEGRRVLLSLRPHEEFIKIVFEELVNLLGPADNALALRRGEMTTIMMCGLQGAGKTTTCGKLAVVIKEQKLKPFLIAADLQRPAAIEQLHVLGKQLGVGVFSKEGASDPVSVCREGVAAAKASNADVVILDTAGRLAIDAELMDQLKQIDRQINPNQVLLVVDGMTGQDAVNSAKAFNDALSLDGVIMTKLDGDARGGALLSVKAVTSVPIKFIGTGEHMDALEPFRPEGMASRILSMGDIVEVAREAHRMIDERERKAIEERMSKGVFTLGDFRDMMQKLRKPGLMTKMLSLMPGMGELSKIMGNADNEKEMSRLTGIVDSMTPNERRNPKLIDTSRRNRIAAGCGAQPNQVSDLIKQFEMIGPMLQMATAGTTSDKMKMLQQMQGMMANNPFNPLGGMKIKGNTGKRLTPKEREKLMKEREKLLRKKKRGE
ncbi:MAG: signal recognition particle protein [Planctomycetes bacterium]|nr:signal recognition particle protein [Planctomycetota bacterium]